MTIDHLGETPVYQQLASILRDRIERGDLEGGRPLPSYVTLIQQYGLARGTVAKAVGVLVRDGMVRIVPGRGAFVVPESQRP